MTHPEANMKPIWWFVGLMLLAMGAVVLAAGLYLLAYPPARATVLAGLRPNLWWGGVLMLAGAIFVFTHRASKG
jgi:hypothetical protein